MDNAKIHQAAAGAKWLAAHPRFELLYLPTYCPQANPIERAFGDVHDKCTRNHTRKRIWHLVQDVKRHLQVNGPWRYALSAIYYTPEVTAAVQALYDAADDDSATGGPDLTRRIFPVVSVITADGHTRMSQDQVAAIADLVIAGRMQRPDGPSASLI